jgi:DNA-binding NarL/FixJ family response regulator
LIAGILKVQAGETVLAPGLGPYDSEERKKRSLKGVSILGRELSSREREVLQLIAEGYVNKNIASTLSISKKTVEKHREHLMKKLNLHDTASLTRYAVAHGMVETNPSGTN